MLICASFWLQLQKKEKKENGGAKPDRTHASEEEEKHFVVPDRPFHNFPSFKISPKLLTFCRCLTCKLAKGSVGLQGIPPDESERDNRGDSDEGRASALVLVVKIMPFLFRNSII